MSLSSAISNALSGMRASSAAADITGNNLANATNENYARRDLVVQANSTGSQGGVEIVGVRRQSNPVMAATWRDANAAAASADERSRHAGAVQALYGDPTESAALTNQITRLQEALISASARPDLPERLTSAVTALDSVVGSTNAIGDGIQRQRERADREIDGVASRMNDILANLERLNTRILEAASQGQDRSSLLDRQDTLLDELSGITDIRVYPRDREAIAVYATGGMVLLDGSAAEVSFTPTPVITADLTLAGGNLGTLQINGTTVETSAESGSLRGGTLGALFDTRDTHSVRAQAEIDAFAFDLANRLNDPALDPTRSAADIGALTDRGLQIDPADTVGLSNRLSLNAALDPMQGGDPALLRDGLLAAGPGPVGNAALLNGLADQLTAKTSVASGFLAGTSVSLDDFASRLTGRFVAERMRAEDDQVFSANQSETLRAYKLESTVDSDAELQKLMLIEQAYAANAQVLRSLDEMMETLMGIMR